MLLGINTATQIHSLALLEDGQILAEANWAASRDDVDRLVPTLQGLLIEVKRPKADISQIVVVRGPGSFTAVRTGVAFANALAHALGVSLHALDTFDVLARDPKTLVLLHAGGQDVALHFEGETKVGPLSNLLAPFAHDEYRVVAELRETQSKELHSICLEKNWKQIPSPNFAATLIAQELPEATEQAEVIYLKGPHIQKSANPWKQ